MWSRPQVVNDVPCHEFSAAIDGDSGYHVVASCEGGMQHFTSPDGVEWSADPMPDASRGGARDPQVAIDGGRAYVAYTMVEFTGDTCSPDPYEKLGVEVQSRELPDGEWGDPVPVGEEGEELQSFRAVGGVLYATVTSRAFDEEGLDAAFVRLEDGTSTRVEILDATSTSLRIGDDGEPRIAYSTGRAIHVGTVDGEMLTDELVHQSGGGDLLNPALVLAPGDVASLVWTQDVDPNAGCGGEEPEVVGTFFATDEAGTWAVTQVSDEVGATSLTLDSARGETHALVATGEAVHHLARASTGEWSSTFLPGGNYNPVIRVDPTSDALVAFVMADDEIQMYTQR